MNRPTIIAIALIAASLTYGAERRWYQLTPQEIQEQIDNLPTYAPNAFHKIQVPTVRAEQVEILNYYFLQPAIAKADAQILLDGKRIETTMRRVYHSRYSSWAAQHKETPKGGIPQPRPGGSPAAVVQKHEPLRLKMVPKPI